MWIFSKAGFFSIVEHRSSPDLMLVRSRTKGDLDRMIDAMSAIMPKKDAEKLREEIEEAPRADYRWRLIVPRTKIRKFLDREVEGIHYTTSVKTQLDQGDPKRHSAMMAVWSAMMRLQHKEMAPGKRSFGGGTYGEWDYRGRADAQDELDLDFTERLSRFDRGDEVDDEDVDDETEMVADDLDPDVFDLLWDLVNTSDSGEFESIVERAKVILRLEDEISG